MHVDNRKLMVLYGDITTKILGKHLHIEYANMYKSHLETCGWNVWRNCILGIMCDTGFYENHNQPQDFDTISAVLSLNMCVRLLQSGTRIKSIKYEYTLIWKIKNTETFFK